MSTTKYAVLRPGMRERFEGWIRTRGGVAVWRSVDMSNMNAGDCYTPALGEDGEEYEAPHWRYERRPTEVVKDISRFRFVTEMREVDRFHVAHRPGAQGLRTKLTDASSNKLHKRLRRAGPEAIHVFDLATREAVIEVPIWE